MAEKTISLKSLGRIREYLLTNFGSDEEQFKIVSQKLIKIIDSDKLSKKLQGKGEVVVAKSGSEEGKDLWDEGPSLIVVHKENEDIVIKETRRHRDFGYVHYESPIQQSGPLHALDMISGTRRGGASPVGKNYETITEVKVTNHSNPEISISTRALEEGTSYYPNRKWRELGYVSEVKNISPSLKEQIGILSRILDTIEKNSVT